MLGQHRSHKKNGGSRWWRGAFITFSGKSRIAGWHAKNLSCTRTSFKPTAALGAFAPPTFTAVSSDIPGIAAQVFAWNPGLMLCNTTDRANTHSPSKRGFFAISKRLVTAAARPETARAAGRRFNRTHCYAVIQYSLRVCAVRTQPNADVPNASALQCRCYISLGARWSAPVIAGEDSVTGNRCSAGLSQH